MPLHWACSAGHSNIAVYLVEDYKVPVNAQDDVSMQNIFIKEFVNIAILEKNNYTFLYEEYDRH